MLANQDKNKVGFQVKGDWVKQAKLLKVRFPKLTTADLQYEPGKENELLSKMAARLNKKREDIMDILKKMTAELN